MTAEERVAECWKYVCRGTGADGGLPTSAEVKACIARAMDEHAAEARDEALEEAASVCDKDAEISRNWREHHPVSAEYACEQQVASGRCAMHIRALKARP